MKQDPSDEREAYGRVTNEERFRALHEAALRCTERLEKDFDVTVQMADEIDPDLEDAGVARPGIRLVPRSENAAPITIVFTPFPGLQVRFGNSTDRFPACGCDACGETAKGEVARFEELIEDVTAGRFREYFDRYENEGEWITGWECWSPSRHYARGFDMDNGPPASQTRHWSPWPVRGQHV
jgi:hypothetical protein